jgi:hypothetical protein
VKAGPFGGGGTKLWANTGPAANVSRAKAVIVVFIVDLHGLREDGTYVEIDGPEIMRCLLTRPLNSIE